MSSIWSQIKRAAFVIHFKNLDEIKKFREAIKDTGLNINDCEVIAVVESKKEKDVLTEISSVTYINEKDFGFLGKIKNENFKKLVSRSFDGTFFIGDFSKKILKNINLIKTNLKVGINSQIPDCIVYVNTNNDSATHLINFAKQTLEKTI